VGKSEFRGGGGVGWHTGDFGRKEEQDCGGKETGSAHHPEPVSASKGDRNVRVTTRLHRGRGKSWRKGHRKKGSTWHSFQVSLKGSENVKTDGALAPTGWRGVGNRTKRGDLRVFPPKYPQRKKGVVGEGRAHVGSKAPRRLEKGVDARWKRIRKEIAQKANQRPKDFYSDLMTVKPVLSQENGEGGEIRKKMRSEDEGRSGGGKTGSHGDRHAAAPESV